MWVVLQFKTCLLCASPGCRAATVGLVFSLPCSTRSPTRHIRLCWLPVLGHVGDLILLLLPSHLAPLDFFLVLPRSLCYLIPRLTTWSCRGGFFKLYILFLKNDAYLYSFSLCFWTTPCSMWDLSSPTRPRTRAPCSRGTDS